jgi:hypothetical protein
MAADDRWDDLFTVLRELPLRIDRVIENRDRQLGALLEPLASEMRAEAREAAARARAAEKAARETYAEARAAREEAREQHRALIGGFMRVIDRLDRLDPGSGPAAA